MANRTYNRNQSNNYHGKRTGAGGKKRDRNRIQMPSTENGPYAPYNFVPISRKIFKDPKDKTYSLISDETYTGEIRYSLTAKTPIFIDSGKEERAADAGQSGFFKNKDGRYAIPGSTMRGLIRNNVQILGFSDVKDDIDDYHLMYRAVTGGCMQDTYNKVLGQKTENKLSVLTNVKAGYMKKEGENYYIYPNREEDGSRFRENHPNYYVVSERIVLEEQGVRNKDFQYLLQRFQNKDAPFIKSTDKYGRLHYKGTPNPDYVPYSLPVSYKLSDGRVRGIAEKGILEKDGYVISSGFMNEKKAFYVIPEIDDNPEKRKKVSPEAVTAYKVDLNNRRNTIKKEHRSFYELPKDGEIRPVFYIDFEGRLYFGYTPRLRLMYKNSIHKGVSQDKVKALDFAKNMFGFSDDNALKSKLFFTDAVLSGEGEKIGERKVILGGPKPTSYLEYLKQTNGQEVSTYDDGVMRLRGLKQYWLHEEAWEEEQTEEGKNTNDKVKSRLDPLDKGSCFTGTVRFQNLSKEELGLLLWSIRLEKNSQMNVGKGKPYGFGRIKVDAAELYLTDPKESYTAALEAFLKNPLEKKSGEETDEFVNGYKAYASNELKHDVMDDPSVKDFLTMKSAVMKGRDVEYMPLDAFKTHKRDNHPLPGVGDVAKRNRNG